VARLRESSFVGCPGRALNLRAVGAMVVFGAIEGWTGPCVGAFDGRTGLCVGAFDGRTGLCVGAFDGWTGLCVGGLVGMMGLLVGAFDGVFVGDLVGGFVGMVGLFVGAFDGVFVGDLVGGFVGGLVGGRVLGDAEEGTVMGGWIGGGGRDAVAFNGVSAIFSSMLMSFWDTLKNAAVFLITENAKLA
jgi:hypothetical protein